MEEALGSPGTAGTRLGVGGIGEFLRLWAGRSEGLVWKALLGGEREALVCFRDEVERLERWLAVAAADSGLSEADAALMKELGEKLRGYAEGVARMEVRVGGPLRRETPIRFAADLDAIRRPFEVACGVLAVRERAGLRIGAGVGLDRGSLFGEGAMASAGFAAGVGLALGLVGVMGWVWRRRALAGATRVGSASGWAEAERLSAELAHEIRNPMTVLKGEMLEWRRKGVGDVEALDRWTGEIRRMERLLEDFLVCLRPPVPRREVVRASELADGVVALVGRTLGERGIEVVRSGNGGVDGAADGVVDLWVEVDPDQMRQALLNLLRNAAQSMPSGGRIWVGVVPGRCSRGEGGGSVVRLEVRDEGVGMAPEVQDRLFEAEAVASSRSGGAGLGLSIASRLVAAQGGHLEYQAREGGGTVFAIVLPRRGGRA